jgi:hypothetical protein
MKGPRACFAGARLYQRIGEAPGFVREECIGISAPFKTGQKELVPRSALVWAAQALDQLADWCDPATDHDSDVSRAIG